ncbi:amidase [Streptomyces sp. NPDC058646]|uniref:amidase n=1 Tax=Streptomyces sp. NPDC058646 TaxID=3346574 RepID=UPI003661A958
MNEAVEAAEFAFELGWKLRGLETALAPRVDRGPAAGDPQPPVPPGRQRFTLVHCPVEGYPGFDDPRYASLKADPPQGCAVEDFGGALGLRCDRPGGRLLDAVADVCAEIRTGHGLLMTGLGVDRLWEWSEDGTDGWGAEIVGQLLLMAAERGPKLGYGVGDLGRFLREAAGA